MKLKFKLHSEVYIYCSLNTNPFSEDEILFSFKEKECKTFLVPKAVAEKHNVSFNQLWAFISVETFTSLSAIGITAHISGVLSKENIPCNMIAAFHHDYLFVPLESAKKVMIVLSK
tara:strand:- start:468 stop:815 length:348 start_codon:yes stop_codon:yes gene_type:complete